jgi:aspartate racemase
MKTIGIIGGIGPETTIVYYKLLIAAGHTRILINSVDPDTLVPMVLREDVDAVAGYLSASIARLASGGADVALIAANTPHFCFDEIARRSSLPLVSIVEAAADHVKARGLRRAALFGTRVTMQGRFFPEVFGRHGVEIVLPSTDEQAYIHDKYMGELFKGIIRDETRQALLDIVDAVAARHAIDGVILGGTELSLILTAPAHDGIPLIDTTRVHVDAVLGRVAP